MAREISSPALADLREAVAQRWQTQGLCRILKLRRPNCGSQPVWAGYRFGPVVIKAQSRPRSLIQDDFEKALWQTYQILTRR